MYIKALISTPPPVGEWVVVIDQVENMFIAQFNEHGGFNYRDASGSFTPNNNIQLTHWLKKIDEHEQLGKLIGQLEKCLFSIGDPIPAMIHLDHLRTRLGEIVPILKECYVNLFGENPRG